MERTFSLLYLDDDPDDHYIVGELVKEAQKAVFRLHATHSVNEARRLLAENCYDALLLDYHLGCCTGDEFLQASNCSQSIPVVMLSTDPEIVERKLADPLVGFPVLSKWGLSTGTLEETLLSVIPL